MARGQPWTYRLLLLGVIGALGSLPLIKVDVSVRAPAWCGPRPNALSCAWRFPAGSSACWRATTSRWRRGQALVVLASTDLDERLARNRALQAERRETIEDLTRLVAPPSGSVEQEENFRTSTLRQEYSQHQVQLAASRLAETRARNECARVSLLAAKGIVTHRNWIMRVTKRSGCSRNRGYCGSRRSTAGRRGCARKAPHWRTSPRRSSV